MQELMDTLKAQIVEQLNLKHINPADISDDEPLFGDGGKLNLDSIDALELIVLVQQKYGLKLADPADGPKVFSTVKTMASFITESKK